MTPERWNKIEQIYHAALERDAHDRTAFLEQACGGDDDLRREVDSLLAYQSGAEDFIETPAAKVMAQLMANDKAYLSAGRRIGPYRIDSLLGSGGMGEVYLAHDSRLGRKVALKLLPAAFTEDQERVHRFEHEARAASALNHPNILTVYEIGQGDGVHYIATEFIAGQTLRQRLASGRLPLTEALEVAIQVASALVAAHEAGIMHRDIKPENIMVRPDQLVKVLDLGLAKLVQSQTSPMADKAARGAEFKTETGVVIGTARYMSPEQARGKPVDARTDLFSLGVVMYEMVAGRAPFAGETTADVIASLLEREPRQLSQITTDIPAAFEQMVGKALSKERDARYQTAKELLFDLKRLKQHLEFEQTLGRSQSRESVNTEAARLSANPAAKATPAQGQTPKRQSRKLINSLAVLPLANISADPATEYLSDGITESIINTLSQLPKLRVVARSTAFRFKGQDVELQEIGRRLGVGAVLTGRVRQIANSLVISVELIDVASESQLWGESYNRELANLFEIQDEIAGEITGKLRLKLSRKEKRRLARRHTDKIEAYQAYLKGRYFWNKRTAEWLNKGVTYFKQAIELDPAYAPAYAGLSDSYTLLVIREAIAPEEGFAKAKAAARTALQIDEQLGEAHASLAHAMLHNWEWADAEKGFKRAIELNPGYASAHHWYSEYLLATGQLDDAIAEIKRAQALDPLSLIINAHFGEVLYYARRYDQCIEQAHKTLELDANFFIAHMELGRAYSQKGMYEKGLAEIQRARELLADSLEGSWWVGYIHAASGKTGEARRIIEHLQAQSGRHYVSPFGIALIYAALGEKDEAFDWLEKAYRVHDGELFNLQVEPALDCLRADPRHLDLLRRVGLQPEAQAIPQAALKRMAVLPFRPIQTEQRDRYLELGMADALITKLSNLSQIAVRPTSAIRKFADREPNPVTAGIELQVEAVLEGSIQKAGDRIRITVRLVSVTDGRSVWADKFDEDFTDIFAVQDSISEKVAAALALQLSGADKDKLTKRYTENTAAYHHYLKGRYYWNKRSEEAVSDAIECFKQAIAADPGYGLAYAGLADCYTKLGDVGVTAIMPGEAFARGRAAALKALEIDGSIAEVYASLGHLDMHLLRWSDARRDFERAIELNPNYATAHQWYAYYMAFHQRFDEALEKIAIALRLDPLSLPILDSLGEFMYFARRNDEAIEYFQKALKMDADFLPSRINLGRAYEQAAMYREAEEQFLKASKITNQSIDALAGLGHMFARSGNRSGALAVLAEIIETAKKRYVSPYDIALIHTALGQTEAAFEWLNRAYDECAEWMIYTGVDPRLEPLQTDARFAQLLVRLGFLPKHP